MRGGTVFLFDMDGVLYHGERPIAAGLAFAKQIPPQRRVFVTNNSAQTPEHYRQRLANMGLAVAADQIITSAGATANLLAHECPGFRYFAVGGVGLHEALKRVGHEDAECADYVIIGEGAGIDYEALRIGGNRVCAGAELVVTNPDASVDALIDGEHQILPGGGALVAPFEIMTGHQARVIGKPHPPLYEAALKRLGAEAADAIMVGDRPDTDIAGAAALGLRTVLVRTGRFGPGVTWPDGLPMADFDVNSLAELDPEAL